MQFGLFALIPRRDVRRPPSELFAETFELAALADAAPEFDSAWIAEHHFSNYGLVPSPLPFIATLAERTRRLRLGMAVLVLPFYQPLRLAEDIALVDQLSGGRLIVGVGRGYQPYEFARFGQTLDESRLRFDEALEVLVLALSRPTFSYEGATIRIPSASLATPPLQQPHPPIVVAASTEESLGLAARHGFGVMTTASWNPIEEIGRTRALYDAQLERAGRSAEQGDFSAMRFVYVTDSRRDMLDAAEQAMWITRVSLGMRLDQAQVVAGEVRVDPFAEEPSPEVFAERMIFGDAETCIEKLERARVLLRPTRLICNLQLGGLEHARVRRSFERFLERVAPHFARAARPVPVGS